MFRWGYVNKERLVLNCCMTVLSSTLIKQGQVQSIDSVSYQNGCDWQFSLFDLLLLLISHVLKAMKILKVFMTWLAKVRKGNSDRYQDISKDTRVQKRSSFHNCTRNLKSADIGVNFSSKRGLIFLWVFALTQLWPAVACFWWYYRKSYILRRWRIRKTNWQL